jgi:hypothetical protein
VSTDTATRRRGGWTPGRIVLVVVGSLLALIGLAVLAGGAFLLWADRMQRDEDGYFTTSTERLSTAGHALVGEDFDIADEVPNWIFGEGRLATVRIRARADDPNRAVFLGIGPERDVAAYLAGVEHSVVTDLDDEPFRAEYRDVAGTRTPEPPGAQGFWAARASGPGRQDLRWDVRSGRWTAVAMYADGSPGVDLDVDLGATADWVFELSLGLIAGGAVLLALAVLMIVLAARRARRSPEAPRGPPGAPGGAVAGRAAAGAAGEPAGSGEVLSGPPPAAAVPAAAPSVTAAPAPPPPPDPVAVEGELDPRLSRWLWLVTWLLALPYWIVLVVLWVAFAAVTLLVTGRYPRSIFELVVGLNRWVLRVLAYAALMRDEYPPFRLGR